MSTRGNAEIRMRNGGISSTVTLTGLTLSGVSKRDFATKFIPILVDYGREPANKQDEFFKQAESANARYGAFMIYSAYDLAPHYYHWINRMVSQKRSVNSDTVDCGPIRFEHDVIGTGTKSRTFHTIAFDDATGKLLVKYTSKGVFVDLKAKRPIPIPNQNKDIAHLHTQKRIPKQYASLRIPKDISFLSSYTTIFTKTYEVMKTYIDRNEHAGYLVSVLFASETLVDALQFVLHNKPFYVKHQSVVYKRETLVGDKLDVNVCFSKKLFDGNTINLSGNEMDIIVKVEKDGTIATLCRYIVSTTLEPVQHNSYLSAKF